MSLARTLEAPIAGIGRRGRGRAPVQARLWHGDRDDSGLVGGPPTLLGFAAVFRLDDGRLVTMRWTLDALLEDCTEAA